MTARTLGLAELAAELLGRAGEARSIVAIAGAPGSGKSTLAGALADDLNARRPGVCAIAPMDGFHFDDTLLEARGWRARKGAPHTFDVGGLAAILRRLRARDEDEVVAPVFDRSLEIARAGARPISRRTPLVLVEGNYLLLRTAPWAALAPLFDLRVFVDCDKAILRERLGARWRDAGMTPAEIDAKLGQNDLPNGELVMRESAAPDIVIRSDA